MSGRGGFKRNRRGNPKQDGKAQSSVKNVDESSPVIQMFRECQCLLDRRHDKHERLVKLSRDITIDSKRAIFQLHRISGSTNPEEILKEAEDKIKEIQDTKWKMIAMELHSEDPYQFLRAYSPGLQEFIEAVSFWYYLREKDLISLEKIEERLKFQAEMDKFIPQSQNNDDQHSESQNIAQEKKQESDSQSSDRTTTDTAVIANNESASVTMTEISVHIPPMEYMLGIADLTGELMRMAINSVGSGDLTVPFELCSFMRIIHDAFVLFGNIQRELPRKLSTLKASLKKVETACYTLQVRGSEIPKHMLKDVFSSGIAHGEGEFDVGSGD